MWPFTKRANKATDVDKEIEGIQAAYYEWIKEVETAEGRTDKVLALYAPDAILLPTLSPKICTSKEMLDEYFTSFLSLKDLEAETEELITKIHGDVALNTGLYTFTHKNDKKRHAVHARFDFWYKKVDGKWKIIFHQSSMLPVVPGQA